MANGQSHIHDECLNLKLSVVKRQGTSSHPDHFFLNNQILVEMCLELQFMSGLQGICQSRQQLSIQKLVEHNEKPSILQTCPFM